MVPSWLLFTVIAACSDPEPASQCFGLQQSECLEPECLAELGLSCDGGPDVFACADGTLPCNDQGVACQPVGGGVCVEWLAGCVFQEEDSCPPGWEFCQGSDGVSCPLSP